MISTWEQRKLGEIATYRNGKAHEANQLDVGTYELVNLNSISIDGGLKPSGKFIEDGSDTLQRNDLVMVLSDVGHGDLLGRVAIIPENNRYVLNQRVALLRINDDTNTYFLFSIINRYQDYFKKLGAGSSQLNISRGIVENFEVAYPNVAEQRMIADYFQSLDHLITLHQRKLEHVKKMKKSMLQKMFPKKNQLYPEVRFPGFTDAWEQRKLGEYVEITSGEAPAKFQEGDINYVKVDDLNYAYKTVINTQNKVLKNSSVKMVQAGSVIFPKRGAAILTNKVRVLGVDSYMDTNMMALSSEKLDTNFLYTMLSKEGLYKIADTSTIPQINNKHIEPYKIYLPSMDEQLKIGIYFSNLDNLITLHQRELDHLQLLKKGMLQQMFI